VGAGGVVNTVDAVGTGAFNITTTANSIGIYAKVEAWPR
jgi:hypothetical protein